MKILKQAGFTLIELVISIGLGLAMIAVALQYLIGSSATYSATETASRIQENARFALTLFSDEIRMAGYAQPGSGSQPGFFFRGTCGAFNPCTANGEGTLPDRIAIWSNPPPDDGSERDCTASALAANAQIANVYYLTTASNGVTSLMCRGFNVTTNQWNAAAQPLLDGIDNMQVLYGVRAANGTSRYVNADSVGDWSQVLSVRLMLLVSSGSENGGSPLQLRTYELLDAPPLEYTDTFIRRPFSTTVVINNAVL